MNTELKPLKPFVQSERESIRTIFARRASEAPIPDPFNAASMQEWEEYVEEMRNLESQMEGL